MCSTLDSALNNLRLYAVPPLEHPNASFAGLWHVCVGGEARFQQDHAEALHN